MILLRITISYCIEAGTCSMFHCIHYQNAIGVISVCFYDDQIYEWGGMWKLKSWTNAAKSKSKSTNHVVKCQQKKMIGNIAVVYARGESDIIPRFSAWYARKSD